MEHHISLNPYIYNRQNQVSVSFHWHSPTVVNKLLAVVVMDACIFTI